MDYLEEPVVIFVTCHVLTISYFPYKNITWDFSYVLYVFKDSLKGTKRLGVIEDSKAI